MDEQHLAILKMARDRLIDDRRATAKVLADTFEPAKSLNAGRTIVELQTMIEAIDRAIDDEQGAADSIYDGK